jgi:ferrous iron transport protein B
LYQARSSFQFALVGNPNTGKTSLFNALTGFRRHVANFPGVTVDAARGPVRGTECAIELLDLPGAYSVVATSPDEAIVRDVLAGRSRSGPQPDAILAIADATNLSRNLYLVSQLLETGLPIVLAVNMMDVAAARGLTIDIALLSSRLGIPVVPITATRAATLPPLREALVRTAQNQSPRPKCVSALPPALLSEIESLRAHQPNLTIAEAVRRLLDPPAPTDPANAGEAQAVLAARARLAATGIDGPAAEVRARYAWLASALAGVVARPAEPRVTWSDRLDRILTHRFAGALVLLAVLFVVFQAIFTWAAPVMDLIDRQFAWLAGIAAAALPEGPLQSFICDGLIAGVGGVLVFLPQILILFGFIALLEDCGYLARAAYMMDRLMRAFGLGGRAFVPLLASFACAVPAILGTRTIADRRERFVTILLAPFMSCSARLPVYILIIAACVPDIRVAGWLSVPALVMLAMYLLGVLVAIPIAWILRKTAFAGPSGGFMLELPSFKWPRWQAVVQRMLGAGRKFLIGAGTVIIVVNMIVWAAAYYPRSPIIHATIQQQAAVAGWDDSRTEHELAGAYLRDSYLGRTGRWIEPVVRPLGWDWRIGVAVLASFPAREVVVATLGTIYNLGAEEDESSESLRTAIQTATWPGTDQRVFTLPAGLSLMVFFALCAQCTSTLVVIGRETRSWVWPIFSFASMTAIAYVAAWLTVVAANAISR